MEVRLDALPTQLAKRIAPLYVIHGDEHLLALEAADRIRAAARAAGYTERDVLTVDRYFNWGRLAESGQSMSLFGDRKFVEVRIPGGKPGKEGSAALQAYAGRVADGDVVTLVTLPRLERDQGRSAWFTALDAAGITIEAPLVDVARLPAWIDKRLAAQGQSADADTIAFIVDRVEGNLLAAHQEVQKLALLHPPGRLAFENVRNAVLDVARYNVFKLGEAMLAGDGERVARMIDGLKGEGESPVLVHFTMSGEIRTLLRAKLGGPSLSLRQLGVWGAREKLFPGALARLSLPSLRHALAHAVEIDRLVKGLRSLGTPMGDPWSELSRLGVAVAGGG